MTPGHRHRPAVLRHGSRDGSPLTAYCDERRLTVPERLALFVAVCRAVQHAHQKGVIHRDLKPSNILITEVDGKPVPKIIDFGLAKALSGDSLSDWSLVTIPGAIVGTPLYMAPEQAGGNPADVDTRADVYSLGVILYELLTGTTPIERGEVERGAPDELLRVIREKEADRPSSRLTSSNTPAVAAARQTEPARLTRLVKGELDWITLKALEKDRSRRYEGAGACRRRRPLPRERVGVGGSAVAVVACGSSSANRGAVIATGWYSSRWWSVLPATVRLLEAARARSRRAETRREFQRDRAVTAEGGLTRQLESPREKKRADEEAETARGIRLPRQDILLLADPRNQADRGRVANPD